MTDIDALARRIAAYTWLGLMGDAERENLAKLIKEALREAGGVGFSEGFAAGAQAMREAIIGLITGRYDEFFSGDADLGLFVAMARALPLPDEKEKP